MFFNFGGCGNSVLTYQPLASLARKTPQPKLKTECSSPSSQINHAIIVYKRFLIRRANHSSCYPEPSSTWPCQMRRARSRFARALARHVVFNVLLLPDTHTFPLARFPPIAFPRAHANRIPSSKHCVSYGRCSVS